MHGLAFAAVRDWLLCCLERGIHWKGFLTFCPCFVFPIVFLWARIGPFGPSWVPWVGLAPKGFPWVAMCYIWFHGCSCAPLGRTPQDRGVNFCKKHEAQILCNVFKMGSKIEPKTLRMEPKLATRAVYPIGALGQHVEKKTRTEYRSRVKHR